MTHLPWLSPAFTPLPTEQPPSPLPQLSKLWGLPHSTFGVTQQAGDVRGSVSYLLLCRKRRGLPVGNPRRGPGVCRTASSHSFCRDKRGVMLCPGPGVGQVHRKMEGWGHRSYLHPCRIHSPSICTALRMSWWERCCRQQEADHRGTGCASCFATLYLWVGVVEVSEPL